MDEMRLHLKNKDKAWLVSTLNSAGDAIITCDLDNQLDFANAEALRILGRRLSDVLGKPLNDVLRLYRDGQQEPIQFWEYGENNQVTTAVGLPRRSYYLRPDGHKSYLSAHLSPLPFKAFMNIARESFLEDIQSHMKKADQTRFIDILKDSLEEQSNFNMELELLAPNNTYRTFRGMGRPLYDKNREYAGMIGMFLDIHDERFAEELFIKSQKKYYSLFKYMDSSISYFKALYDEGRNLVDAELVEMNLLRKDSLASSGMRLLGTNYRKWGFWKPKKVRVCSIAFRRSLVAEKTSNWKNII
ncbi:PAS domain-containing protein [Acetobacterium wieringae]|uniref:PAS domain-containing protein n=1 Tax=Acetobacterium wieringae TaxID=52694 RepID=UPI002033D822|nr:PAS domain-containing protein [Acetobacterium wieringae]URN82744.1 PAS domain-containing protein [Acetobacterium wieringae]